MPEAPELTGHALRKARKTAVPITLVLAGIGGFPLWNLFLAASESRILHTGRYSKSRWVVLAEDPGFFWYDVITSLALLMVVGWFLFVVIRRVRWLPAAKPDSASRVQP